MDTMDRAQQGINLTRNLTRAGNFPNLPVALGASSVMVTFPLAELDTGYGVKVTPGWDTTFWVSNKAVTGCTISFGTPAPPNATCDVSTFRSE